MSKGKTFSPKAQQMLNWLSVPSNNGRVHVGGIADRTPVKELVDAGLVTFTPRDGTIRLSDEDALQGFDGWIENV